MAARVRLLPAAIAVGMLALSLKIGVLWQDNTIALFPSAIAEPDKKSEPKSDPSDRADAQAARPPDEDGQKAAKKDTPAARAKPGVKEGSDAKKAGQTGARSKVFDAAKATDVELELLQNLAVRRTELDRRENALRLQIAALAAVEMRIAAKLADMSKIKAEIEALLKRYDDDEEAKLRSLVKIYENMKPKSAARIFQKLDMKVLLDVVERMREVKAAPIMAKMAPERAKEITTELAARRRLPNIGNKQSSRD